MDGREQSAMRFLAGMPNEMQRHPQVAKRVLADPGLPAPAPGSALDGLRRATVAQLGDGEFSFELLLGDDDLPLRQRAQALFDWCRSFLGGSVAFALSRSARAEESELESDLRNLTLVDAVEDKRRFTLIFPKYLNPEQRMPLVVLLHGLGETGDPKAGAYAWLSLYGGGAAWQRMKRAPLERTSKRGEWTDARLAEVNGDLEKRPFHGFALACPHMPNLQTGPELDAYAKWIETSLIPRCRKETRTI